jgi:hypothetical protein
MSRNRLKNSQSLHWMGVVKWVLILGLVSVLGLSYMFCKNQNLRLAEQRLKLVRTLNSLEQRNTARWLDLEMMKAPAQLTRRLAANHSTLVRLSDPRMLAHLYHMEGEHTRMILARAGTDVPVNVDIDKVGSSASSSQDSQR